SIKRRFRFVADRGGDLRDSSRCLFERSRGEVEAPFRQIRHRWFGEVSGETFHERGSGDADFACETGDCPWMRHAVVEQGEALPDNWIARAGEPARLAIGQATDVAPQRIDEEGFRKLCEHSLAADLAGCGLLYQMK